MSDISFVRQIAQMIAIRLNVRYPFLSARLPTSTLLRGACAQVLSSVGMRTTLQLSGACAQLSSIIRFVPFRLDNAIELLRALHLKTLRLTHISIYLYFTTVTPFWFVETDANCHVIQCNYRRG
jgi:hypothetical protein